MKKELTNEQIKARKNANKKVLTFGCLPIIIIIMIFVFTCSQPDEPTPKTRTEIIENQFSEWDGSHKKLEDFIKSQMNNPDSYEHVQTIYWDKDSFLLVKTTYRGANVFGGIVTNTASATSSMDGSIIEIVN